MKKIEIYHNPRCSKSRSVCEILTHHKTSFEVIEYLKTPPTESELDLLLNLLGLEPHQIVRTGEDEYIGLDLEKNPPKSRAKWIEVLVENPILIERPIISDGTRAIIGRPPEKVLEFLKN